MNTLLKTGGDGAMISELCGKPTSAGDLCDYHVNMTRDESRGKGKLGKGTPISRFKGVTRNTKKQQSHPWQVACGGRYVGVFATEKEAARAYDTAAMSRYGEFAFLNFPSMTTNEAAAVEVQK